MMRRRQLYACDDDNQGRAKSQSGQCRENDRARRVLWLDGSQSNYASRVDQEANKKRRLNCPELRAHISVDDGNQAGGDPER